MTKEERVQSLDGTRLHLYKKLLKKCGIREYDNIQVIYNEEKQQVLIKAFQEEI